MRPLPGVGLGTILSQLIKAHTRLINIDGQGHYPVDRLNAYQKWANEQALVLSLSVTRSSLKQLIMSDGYSLLQQANPPTHGALGSLLNQKLRQRTAVFARAIEELRRHEAAWQSCRSIVVPDTALLLHHPHGLGDIDWHSIAGVRSERVDIVIPILVIKELDREKDGPGRKEVSKGVKEDTRTRTRARRTLRLIDELFHDPSATLLLTTGQSPATGPVHCRLCLYDPAHQPLPVADAELVDRAAEIRDVSRRTVTLASFDTSLGLRTRTEGLLSAKPTLDPGAAE